VQNFCDVLLGYHGRPHQLRFPLGFCRTKKRSRIKKGHSISCGLEAFRFDVFYNSDARRTSKYLNFMAVDVGLFSAAVNCRPLVTGPM